MNLEDLILSKISLSLNEGQRTHNSTYMRYLVKLIEAEDRGVAATGRKEKMCRCPLGMEFYHASWGRF